ncbi:MAG TPA: metallopeptidase family protein [Marmoricola sp.]
MFRGPLARMCRDHRELVDEVQITVVHEVAHHFGIDDAQLHEWGWG